jgi:hypothetical protein
MAGTVITGFYKVSLRIPPCGMKQSQEIAIPRSAGLLAMTPFFSRSSLLIASGIWELSNFEIVNIDAFNKSLNSQMLKLKNSISFR